MTYHYKTKGTCSTDINLEVEDGIIKDIEFWSGCNGNLQGICRLVKGMPVKDVVVVCVLHRVPTSFVRHFMKWDIEQYTFNSCL